MAAKPIIMIATDLSARSDRPIDRGLLLAQQMRASILILHVPQTDTKLDFQEEEKLQDFLRDEYRLSEDDAEIILGYGSVPSTIAQASEDSECTLVITGVARFNNIGDYFLGTAVDYLVRRSKIPVLVVKRRPRGFYSRLLVATDFSDCSKQALMKAAEIFPDAELRLIHAYHAPFEALLSREETIEFIRSEAEHHMTKFIEGPPGTLRAKLRTAVEEGVDPASVIRRSLEEWSADLLVIGTHGRGGLAHATIGSQASTLLTCEPSDVLVVRGSAA